MCSFRSLIALVGILTLIGSCRAGFNMAVAADAPIPAETNCEDALYDFYCDFHNLVRGRNRNCLEARRQFDSLKHNCVSTDIVRRVFQVAKFVLLFDQNCNIPFPSDGCTKLHKSVKMLFFGKKVLKLKCQQQAHWNGMKAMQDAQKDGCKFAMNYEQEVLYQVAPVVCEDGASYGRAPSWRQVVPRRCRRR